MFASGRQALLCYFLPHTLHTGISFHFLSHSVRPMWLRRADLIHSPIHEFWSVSARQGHLNSLLIVHCAFLLLWSISKISCAFTSFVWVHWNWAFNQMALGFSLFQSGNLDANGAAVQIHVGGLCPLIQMVIICIFLTYQLWSSQHNWWWEWFVGADCNLMQCFLAVISSLTSSLRPLSLSGKEPLPSGGLRHCFFYCVFFC